MTTNTLDLLHAPDLSVFEPPLQRLILCGGGGLPAAYGPLVRYDGTVFIWSPTTETAHPADGLGADLHPLKIPACFVLPLDHWRARLALVAVGVLFQHRPRFAQVCPQVDGCILLAVYAGPFHEPGRHLWSLTGGGDAAARNIPALPAHLTAHDPHVAVPLALWDVPDIRARVEAL